ncbi:sugar nucleotide-binding protein [Sporosarcina thermotolerans]|uniref:dTDP-4-dehydrorhamnose reductase n=1 Tax=Sporosarcina thermotolerans TaxID=633404 RepID=A0AAW9ADU1_9BACL|nr:sugar nucleotide-binding protein [Sporosarcina thermotolerans]MDW0118369.1 sugar nucleotide-binding protein [Sporosarcina thermotolerans]WHT49425.1 sugar nucleotide-binding protein [Sporosarcina thermotolerans]
MKVLVLGASGFLGGHVYHNLLKDNRFKEILGTSKSSEIESLYNIDINDEKKFGEIYRNYNPDFVIWTVMGTVNEETLIHTGLKQLLNMMDQHTKLIYVSTDGIFSSGEGCFDECAAPSYLDTQNPLSSYTNAKLDGEKMIQKEHQNYIVVRTGPLYGQDSKGNWDSRVLALQSALLANKPYKRADNLFKTFVYVEDLANAIIELLSIDYTGFLHVGPKTKESYYTFSLRMAEKLKLDNTLLEPDRIPIKEAKKRGVSLDTSLNTVKCSTLLKTKFREV